MFADLEDITAKAGSWKKSSIFIQMLQHALTSETGAVSVDILTFSGEKHSSPSQEEAHYSFF